MVTAGSFCSEYQHHQALWSVLVASVQRDFFFCIFRCHLGVKQFLGWPEEPFLEEYTGGYQAWANTALIQACSVLNKVLVSLHGTTFWMRNSRVFGDPVRWTLPVKCPPLPILFGVFPGSPCGSGSPLHPRVYMNQETGWFLHIWVEFPAPTKFYCLKKGKEKSLTSWGHDLLCWGLRSSG